MVAVVSGEAAGLLSSSFSVLGQQGVGGNSALGQGNEQVFVNAATGNLVVQGRDDELSSVGADLGVIRTYNSLGALEDIRDGIGSDNWRLGFISTLAFEGDAVYRVAADGAEQRFTFDAQTGQYVSTQGGGAHDTLVHEADNNRWVYTEGSTLTQFIYEDSDAFRLTAILDDEGYGQHLIYAGGQLRRIDNDRARVDASGVLTVESESTFLDYDEVTGLLERVVLLGELDGAGEITGGLTAYYYDYDEQGRLTSVTTDLTSPDAQASESDNIQNTDADVAANRAYRVSYTYHGSSQQIASIVQSDGSELYITYYGDGRVQSIAYGNEADSQRTSYRYDDVNHTTTVTAGSQVTVYGYVPDGRVNAGQLAFSESVVEGQTVRTSFAYDDDGNVTRISDGLGNEVTFGYDEGGSQGRGNQTSQQDSAGNRVERRYDANNQLIAQVLYTVPDPDGLAGPGEASGELVTRYVYDTGADKNALRFVVSSEGDVTEYRYNSLGQRSSQHVYTLGGYALPADADEDIALSSLEAWVLEQNGQVPTGEVDDSGQDVTVFDGAYQRRTDYTYNFRGNLHSSTQYRAVDGDGVGVEGATSYFTYDEGGRLLAQVSAEERVTAYVYDGLGRVISESDTRIVPNAQDLDEAQLQALSTLVSTTYDGTNQQVRTTQANGLVTIQTFDKAGRQAHVEYGLEGDSDTFGDEYYAYDENDRLIAQQYANGAIEYHFYDEAGRLTQTVDRAGLVIEFAYDAASRVIGTRRYETLVNTQGWGSVNTDGELVVDSTQARLITPAEAQAINADKAEGEEDSVANLITSTDDRETAHTFDAAGRKTFDVDEAGYAIEYRYDGANRLTHTIAHAQNALVNDEIVLPSTVSQGSRISRQFYRDDGLLAARLDGEGYITRYTYDRAGQLIGERAYATRPTITDTLTVNLSDITLVTDAKDQVSAYRYNGRGELTTQVGPGGEVSTLRYHDDGQLRTRTEYITRISEYAETGRITLPARDAQDRVTHFAYNARGQLQTESEQAYGSGGAPDSTSLITVTSYYYDTQGQTIGTRVHSETVSIDAQQNKTVVEQDGRASLIARDALGREIGRLDGRDSAALTPNRGARPTAEQIATALNADEVNGLVSDFDAQGRLVSQTDNDGHTTYYYYNARDELVASIGRDGQAQRFRYNSFGELIRTTTFDGFITDDTFRAARPNTTIPVNALNTLTGGDAQDIADLLDTLADAGFQTTTQDYTQRGLLESVSDLSGSQTTRHYNAFGELSSLVTQLTEGATRTDTFEYDNRGLLSGTIIDSLGEHITTGTTYDAFNRPQTQTDANGHVTTLVYDDSQGRIITQYNTANTQGDATAFVSERIDVDVFGRTVSVTDASGITTTTAFDDTSRSEIIRDAHGNHTRLVYNAHGQVIDIYQGERAANAPDDEVVNQTSSPVVHTRYTYDENGNVLTQVVGDQAGGEVLITEYRFDGNNRRIAETIDPAGIAATTTYRYNAQGQAISRTDAEGFVTRYVYDGQGQLTYLIDASGSLTYYTYDEAGRQTSERRYTDAVGDELDEHLIQTNRAIITAFDDETQTAAVLALPAEHAITLTAAQQDALARGESIRLSDTQLASLTAEQSTLLAGEGGVDRSTVVLSNTLVSAWAGSRFTQRFSAYDKAGRLVISIDAQGGVVENTYSARNLVEKQVRYAQA